MKNMNDSRLQKYNTRDNSILDKWKLRDDGV